MTGRPWPWSYWGARQGVQIAPEHGLPCFRPPAPQCEAFATFALRRFAKTWHEEQKARLPEEHPSRGICAARQLWSDPKSPIGHGHHGACASEHTGSVRWLVSRFPQFWARIAIVLPGHRPKNKLPAPIFSSVGCRISLWVFPPKCARFAYPSPMDKVGPCKESYQRLARENDL